MKRALLILAALCGLIVVLVLLRRPAGLTPQIIRTPAQRDTEGPVATSAVVFVTTNKSVLPERHQPAYAEMEKFARAVAIYNFDPTVIASIDQVATHPRTKVSRVTGAVIDTRTHIASVTGGHLDKFISTRESSNPPDPEARRAPDKGWHLCTGKMSEPEAVAETLAILRRLGATATLAQIENGRKEYEAVPMTVPTPDGGKVTVTPFVSVRLYNTNDRLIVSAEYRMGATGSAGLTDWFHWPDRSP